MIYVTRLDGHAVVVNETHIVFVEATPDTVLTLTTGARLMVKETPQQVLDRVVEFRRKCALESLRLGTPEEG